MCVHPEKERERMKCSLSNIEGLSAEIENLGNLGPEELDQAWRDLFGSDRPRRVCGDLLIKALGYRLQEKQSGASNLPLAACSSAGAGTGRSEAHWLSQP
jgi:hypothetical protein